jgi:hypothetical protein
MGIPFWIVAIGGQTVGPQESIYIATRVYNEIRWELDDSGTLKLVMVKERYEYWRNKQERSSSRKEN